jgi:hypothetical protein
MATDDRTAEIAAAEVSAEERLPPVEEKFLTGLVAPSSKPPRHLFHYTTAAGMLGIITSNRLWASDLR